MVTPPVRRQHSRADQVRTDLLVAALRQFSSVGFEAASTRTIAAEAATHQPQINYHFGSKLGLWQAVIDELFGELDETMGELPDGPAHVALAEVCRRFVAFAHRRPELNRIIVHESTFDTERLRWLVNTQVKGRFKIISALCARLDPATVPTTDPMIFYYCLVGASSLLPVNGPEARLLTGRAISKATIQTHADTVTLMLLGPKPRSIS